MGKHVVAGGGGALITILFIKDFNEIVRLIVLPFHFIYKRLKYSLKAPTNIFCGSLQVIS